MSRDIIPIILSGGSGTRLWPLSRKLYPKQYLQLLDHETSLLQDTVLRLSGLEIATAPIVLCNEEHRFLVAEQLRLIERQAAALLLEPAGRNTAPAVAVAAHQALALSDDPVLLVLPADHFISDVNAFYKSITTGLPLARQGRLVTFGIVPLEPETGYGYIKRGEQIPPSSEEQSPCFAISSFVEKPDLATANSYLRQGGYYWNSGMFLFSAKSFLQELATLQPEMSKYSRQAFETGRKDLDFYRLDTDSFAACPADSIDYAVMEKTTRGAVVQLDSPWSDVGSWGALWDIKPKDANGNVIIGDVITANVANSYLHSTGRLLAVVGVQDHVVVETSDAVMVAPKSQVQDIKKLVNALYSSKREEALSHKKVYRPWGSYESIDMGGRFQVKRITVAPGCKLSLQKHYHRAEHWIVVRGTALVTRNEKTFTLSEDQSTYISLGDTHRLENPGKIPLELIEVQTGSYLGEDDIVREEDDFGRIQ